ncbi:hypothetical protein CALVIDRAFT_57326 [Calocera viscosa TUFC12733]|nr:hypothetical protein CALVIDRAFT_57326 [Calocera viscosa TUFC12733]
MECGQTLERHFEERLENEGGAARDQGHRQSSPEEVIELSDNDGGTGRDQGHRHSSPPEVIELSDSSSVDIPRPKQSSVPGEKSRHPSRTQQSKPTTIWKQSKSPSEYNDSSEESEDSVPQHRAASKFSGRLREDGRFAKALPTLSRSELRAIASWKTINGAKRHDWKKTWASVPSLKRMTPDVCCRAYKSQHRAAQLRNEPWPC